MSSFSISANSPTSDGNDVGAAPGGKGEVILQVRIFPIWGTVLLFGFFMFVTIVLNCAFTTDFSVRFFYLPLQLGFIFWMAKRSTVFRIGISSQGIRALSQVHKEALYKKDRRTWDDLHSVRLRKLASPESLLSRLAAEKRSRLEPESTGSTITRLLGFGWLKQGFLLMDFRSGGTLYFPLAGFSNQALEDLFIAISSWADPKVLNPEVVALQRDIFTGQPLHLSDNFTKMWEEDLRSHFQATNFVPLPGGHQLQGGNLKVLMQLACGGMSSIYLVTTPDGQRRVLKELVTPQTANSQTLAKVQELFAREAAILNRLNHPQIVRLWDHFVENGRNYIVLDYIPGLNLKQHVKMNGPFSEADVRKIAGQSAEILHYLHGFTPPVIHRDFTPDNLVIRDSDKKIILIDFGAANEFIGSATGTLIGKQCYISAEQFRGEASAQSDLYSLGATLFYLLTGKEPEPISVSSPRKIMPAVSPEFDEIVTRLTQESPDDRFSSADELSRALERLPGCSAAGGERP